MSTFSDTVHDTQYTLSSHATKESSEHESDLTEMTANTSLTPERSMTSTPPPPQAMNNAKISSNNQLQQQQQQQEIRQSYMAVPETVPDVAAEMNKWFADADRYGVQAAAHICTCMHASYISILDTASWKTKLRLI